MYYIPDQVHETFRPARNMLYTEVYELTTKVQDMCPAVPLLACPNFRIEVHQMHVVKCVFHKRVLVAWCEVFNNVFPLLSLIESIGIMLYSLDSWSLKRIRRT